MYELTNMTRLAAEVQSDVANTLSDIMEERGRGYASNHESWSCLKEQLEKAKATVADIEKLHKEMWDAVRNRNAEVFHVLAAEFERSSRFLAMEWIMTAAMSKIAMELTDG